MSGVEARLTPKAAPASGRKTFDVIRDKLDDLNDASIRVNEAAHEVRVRLVGGGDPIHEDPTTDLSDGSISAFILNRLASIRDSIEQAENCLDGLKQEL